MEGPEGGGEGGEGVHFFLGGWEGEERWVCGGWEGAWAGLGCEGSGWEKKREFEGREDERERKTREALLLVR